MEYEFERTKSNDCIAIQHRSDNLGIKTIKLGFFPQFSHAKKTRTKNAVFGGDKCVRDI